MTPTEETGDSASEATAPGKEAKPYKGRFPWHVYLTIASLALLISATMGYALRSGGRMTEGFMPLVHAAVEIKLDAALGHLWLEEIMSGDRDKDIASVWEHLDQSEWYAHAMLEGGQNSEGTFVPLDDPELRREIETVAQRIAEFRAIAEERFAAQIEAVVGTDMDRRFDAAFEDLLAQTDRVEEALQHSLAGKLRRLRILQGLLIALCVGLAILIAVVIQRYESGRQRALTALHASEENLSSTLNSIGDAVIATDANGVVTRMNPVAEALTGWSADEAIDRPLTDVFNIVNTMTRQTVANPIEKVMREGNLVGLANHTMLIARDGSEYQIADCGAPIRSGDDKIVGVVVVFRDVTEEYRQEEMREVLLRDLGDRVKELTCVYGVTHSIGNRQTIEQVCQDVAELIPPAWQYPEIARGKVCFEGEEFVSGPFQETQWKQTSDIIVDGERCGSVEVYYLRQCPDRDEGPFTAEERNLINIIATSVAEMVKRKRAEMRMMEIQADAAEIHRFNTMGELAAEIAHELNQPLGAIVNYMGVYCDAQDLGRPETEELRSIPHRVAREAERASRITARLRELTGKREPQLSTVDLNDLVVEMGQLLEFALDRAHVTISFDLDRNVPEVICDNVQVSQVLVNLVRNSADAMADLPPDERRITVRSVHDAAACAVEIDIDDTGPGVDASMVDRVFDLFYTTKETGMGVGLAICRSIIEAHGGRMWVESRRGGGGSFRFTIPTHRAEQHHG